MHDDIKVINLDSIKTEYLMSYARVYKLIADKKDLETDEHEYYLSLAQYAAYKALAADLRSEGELSEAARLECRCDQLYMSLPKDLRW
jgi:hypothetical protein